MQLFMIKFSDNNQRKIYYYCNSFNSTVNKTLFVLIKISIMNSVKLISALLLLVVVLGQQCSVQQSLRTDCGYFGINQAQCESKGCCWKPTNLQTDLEGIPWCFFPAGSNPCENITWDGNNGMGFDQSFYDKMYQFFDANINIQGKGGVVAAPDPNTPGGSYYYHWMRDAALTMRTYMEINDFQLSAVQNKMKAYVGWVGRKQKEIDPNGFDIRINPKFELPDGGAYVGGWCRPQTDGPGLRSAALMMFAELLMNNSQSSYAQSNVIPLVKNDLEWVFTNWNSNGCDLWEQVRSSDFFWNRAGYVYSLNMCEKLFNKIGDSSFASRCSSAKSAVQATLNGHWTGSFVTESDNRQKDSAVIHAFSSFDVYSLTDDKVSKTIKTLAMTFCSEYAINQADTKKGEPGVLMGRYPGDSYAGGNPWQLLTAVLAKLFYQGAASALNQGFEELEDQDSWHELLKINKNASRLQFAQAAVKAGDAVMWRLYKYVKNDGGHIAEQIGRNSGVQTSAKDLTWSYANILSAMKERAKSVELIEMKKSLQEQ